MVADSYSDPDCKGNRCIIVADFLAGTVGASGCRRMGVPGGAFSPTEFDSYSGSTPNIWVARREQQLWPRYVVYYGA